MEDAIQDKSTSVRDIDLVKDVNQHYKQRTNEKGAFLTQNKGPFRRDLPDLIKYQRRMVRAAKAQNGSEIRFPGEVSWAINTDDHVKVHHRLKGSAGTASSKPPRLTSTRNMIPENTIPAVLLISPAKFVWPHTSSSFICEFFFSTLFLDINLYIGWSYRELTLGLQEKGPRRSHATSLTDLLERVGTQDDI